MNVGAVVLAAGKSAMEQNKLLVPFEGKTVIEGILEALEAAGISEQIVVLGGDIELVLEAIPPGLNLAK